LKRLALAALLIAHPLSAQRVTRADSISFALATLIPLHEGINAVDITGDGGKGSFVVARRENFNAHSTTVLTAYFQPDPSHWDLLSFWNADKEVLTLGTGEGADCALRDVRVVRLAPHMPVTVIVAQRDFKASYADSEAVHFDIYEFRRNVDESVGWPAEYFVRSRTVIARRAYCDVNAAFAQELGLGTQGLYGVRFQ
jgi:hypothetical protein